MRIGDSRSRGSEVVSVALRFVRSWVWLYTLGLAPETRDARRTELDSDLWDQTHATGIHGPGMSGGAYSVLFRCLRGVPANLFWRFAEARTHRGSTEGRPAMQTFTMRSPFGRATIILVVALIVATITFVVFYDSWYSDPARGDGPVSVALWPWVVLGLGLLGVGLVAIVGGFALMRRGPWLGTSLVVGGVWMVALLFYWLYVPLFIAAGASVFAIVWTKRRANAG